LPGYKICRPVSIRKFSILFFSILIFSLSFSGKVQADHRRGTGIHNSWYYDILYFKFLFSLFDLTPLSVNSRSKIGGKQDISMAMFCSSGFNIHDSVDPKLLHKCGFYKLLLISACYYHISTLTLCWSSPFSFVTISVQGDYPCDDKICGESY